VGSVSIGDGRERTGSGGAPKDEKKFFYIKITSLRPTTSVQPHACALVCARPAQNKTRQMQTPNADQRTPKERKKRKKRKRKENVNEIRENKHPTPSFPCLPLAPYPHRLLPIPKK